tara:strand:- start:3124 stop:3459 length:336 start_codon:yes stop_codon:yes gene_type:complete
MNISKEDLLRINHGFGGNLRSDSSLDFAIERVSDSKLGFYSKLAYLWRAILVDHPFSDGNKRTALFLAYAFAEENKKKIDEEPLVYQAISIAKKNLTNIRQIAWRLQNAIK